MQLHTALDKSKGKSLRSQFYWEIGKRQELFAFSDQEKQSSQRKGAPWQESSIDLWIIFVDWVETKWYNAI